MTTDGGTQAGARTERQMLEELLDWCHDLSGTVVQDEEIEQVRAWVDGLAAQVAALTAERDAADARNAALGHALVRRAMIHHEGMGTGSQGRWECTICRATAFDTIPFRHAPGCLLATTPLAGAQEETENCANNITHAETTRG